MLVPDPYGFCILDHPFLEVEVPPQHQERFEERYRSITDLNITPGKPEAYYSQRNKRAAECRIYFNSHIIADALEARGYTLSTNHPYKSEYAYRVSKQDIWWELVEFYGFRLGEN